MRPIFQGFCIIRFGIGILHYISSRSDFSFEFAKIFVIEKRLPDSASRGVADSPTQQCVLFCIVKRKKPSAKTE
jgi:hypothetical protein